MKDHNRHLAFRLLWLLPLAALIGVFVRKPRKKVDASYAEFLANKYGKDKKNIKKHINRYESWLNNGLSLHGSKKKRWK